MSDNREVRRLEHVYRGYRASQAIQAQWNDNNPGNAAIRRERNAAVEGLLKSHGLAALEGLRALEVGCGSGQTLASFSDLGARPEDLYGVDLLPERIEEARVRYPDCHFLCANAENLDFPDEHFDLAICSTVFSSILDEAMAANVAREIYRVLKLGGTVLWYDFRYNNPRNPNVRGMTLSRIRSLFPGLTADLRTITLLPPLARRLGPLTPLLYPLLSRIPPLRTHYVGLLTKPA